jgi:hypothetical protein
VSFRNPAEQFRRQDATFPGTEQRFEQKANYCERRDAVREYRLVPRVRLTKNHEVRIYPGVDSRDLGQEPRNTAGETRGLFPSSLDLPRRKVFFNGLCDARFAKRERGTVFACRGF